MSEENNDPMSVLWWWGGAVALAAGVVGAVLSFKPATQVIDPAKEAHDAAIKAIDAEIERVSELRKIVKIDSLSFSVDTARILKVSGQLKNAGPHQIKDVLVECDFTGSSGSTIQRRSFTVFQRFPVGKAVSFKSIPIGAANAQVTGTACAVRGYVAGD